MPSDYDSIREKNIEGYGKYNHHLSHFADLYSTRTHFIWELLQNTEDALSRRQDSSHHGYVHFNLLADRLEVRHNGAPFVEDERRRDVSGICGIGEGTKTGDYTQIGTFGIGFKSVYAFTFFPSIHSGDEHFEIKRFVEPHGLTNDDAPAMQEHETCIVLPFDTYENRPEWAFRESLSAEQSVSEISNALCNLGVRSLLFLRQLSELKWTLPDGSCGHFLREVTDETNSSRVVRVTDGDILEEWQLYQREECIQDGRQSHDINVEVAFYLRDGKVQRAKGTELVAYFPTEKMTGLGFLIQAPFKITKSRDNIKSDDPANKQIIKIAGQLTADSLEILRDSNLLDVSSYDALPLQYPEDNFFAPVYEEVRKALREKPLLPAHDGHFVRAEEAKVARGAELTKLFSHKQLGELLGKDELIWLDPSITANGQYSGFYTYLVGRKRQYDRAWDIEPLMDGLLIDANALASRLKSEFLADQDVSWLISFIGYVEKNSRPFLEKQVPILRLQNGEQVSLVSDVIGQPPAYFPPEDDIGLDLSEFPVLIRPLAEHDGVRGFLLKEGIGTIGDLAVIKQCILPKYRQGVHSHDGHLLDVEKIVSAYNKISQDEKGRLENSLKTTPFVLTRSLVVDTKKYQNPDSAYIENDELKTYFSGNDSIAFVKSIYSKSMLEIIAKVGASQKIRITCKLYAGSESNVSLNYNGRYRRGLKGFDPDIKVDGLVCALSNISEAKSQIVWNNIAVKYSNCIKGKVVRSSRQDFSPDASVYEEKEEISKFGHLLINQAWLPGPNKSFLRPCELTLDDLPDAFIRDDKLADQLGMRKNSMAKLAEEVGVNPNDIELLKKYPDALDKLKADLATKNVDPEFPTRSVANLEDREEQVGDHYDNRSGGELDERKTGQSTENGDPDFPTDPVSNLEDREERVGDQYDDSPEKKYRIREGSDRSSRGSINPSVGLRNKYTNPSGQMVCQVCKKEMPFKKKNGEYYFEAVDAFTKKYFNKEHDALFLALCPVCAARYKEFVKLDKYEMRSFKDMLANSINMEMPMQLGQWNTSIRFVEKHFVDIQTILQNSEEDDES